MSTPRRRFLQSLAAAPLLPSAWARAQTPPPTPAPPSPAVAPVPTPSASPVVPGPAAEALGEVVRQRYGSQLEGDDLAEIKKGIEENLRAADRLKKVVLGNADEPVTRFQATPPAPARVNAPKTGGR